MNNDVLQPYYNVHIKHGLMIKIDECHSIECLLFVFALLYVDVQLLNEISFI